MAKSRYHLEGVLACHGCGVVKDTAVLETYPYDGEDDPIVTDRPVPPLFALDAQPREPEAGAWKRVHVCHHCFQKLDADMWISSRCWASIAPVTPWAALPDCPPDPPTGGP